MHLNITVITLGVEDLDRAFTFYHEGMGLPGKGIIGREFEHGAVAFFELPGGLKLAVWPRDSIAHETGIPQSPACATGLTLGCNVASRGAVDELMTKAEKAGATVVKAAAETFWGGYAGYFQDPDGHLWEIVWNPEFGAL